LKNRDEVLRIDSKSENHRLEAIQRDLDANPTEENLRDFNRECFAQNTFDHPFIITTFVQIFETLVSNRNAKLLRLPNFSRTIFLLDEIQALPPNLYTFFVAYLDEFCRKFDSYAIVSTATMPHLEMPTDEDARTVFRRYEKPASLLSDKFYDAAPFNRYRITPKPEINSLEKLADEIRRNGESCLVVLNTVRDTKNLFALLSDTGEHDLEEGEYVLLNTHFTLADRQRKLMLCKERLKNNERIVLISTQLIEAGVDIDFPTLYRDMCPLPSLIQSAGRCNRNNRLDAGNVFLFEIQNDKGKSSADLIYGRNFDWFLEETRKSINRELTEKDMLEIQQFFARKVSDNLIFGQYRSASETINLVECINRSAFADFAKVRLIDQEYGKEFRYYVLENYSDSAFDRLEELVEQSKLIPPRDFDRIKVSRQRIENHLRLMSARIVNLRISEKQAENLTHLGSTEVCGIRCLVNLDYYSPITGIKLKRSEGCIF
jgi:CRISPR-associated endonuclease/helicase Cas3